VTSLMGIRWQTAPCRSSGIALEFCGGEDVSGHYLGGNMRSTRIAQHSLGIEEGTVDRGGMPQDLDKAITGGGVSNLAQNIGPGCVIVRLVEMRKERLSSRVVRPIA
jgi:hypothetical protein